MRLRLKSYMTPYHPSGRVDGSTFVHLIGSHYESVGGGFVGTSLCGRMKGPITDYNKAPNACAACRDKAEKATREENMTITYTQCPNCGSMYPIGNQHDCPTHIRQSWIR